MLSVNSGVSGNLAKNRRQQQQQIKQIAELQEENALLKKTLETFNQRETEITVGLENIEKELQKVKAENHEMIKQKNAEICDLQNEIKKIKEVTLVDKDNRIANLQSATANLSALAKTNSRRPYVEYLRTIKDVVDTYTKENPEKFSGNGTAVKVNIVEEHAKKLQKALDGDEKHDVLQFLFIELQEHVERYRHRKGFGFLQNSNRDNGLPKVLNDKFEKAKEELTKESEQILEESRSFRP